MFTFTKIQRIILIGALSFWFVASREATGAVSVGTPVKISGTLPSLHIRELAHLIGRFARKVEGGHLVGDLLPEPIWPWLFGWLSDR